MVKGKDGRFGVEKDYRIFFAFMTLIVAGMGIWTLAADGGPRGSWRAVPFSVLLAVYVIAHWNCEFLMRKRIGVYLYALGQGALSFVIVLLSGRGEMLLVLYMALVGEMIGFLGMKPESVLFCAYYIGLSFISYLLLGGSGNYLYWLLSVIPILVFVSLYVTLYLRQNEARERAVLLAAELEAANERLRGYADQVEDLTIANERSRMARELHDTLSQGLAGIILRLEAADAHLSRNGADKAKAIVEGAMAMARAVLSEARLAIDDLRGARYCDLDTAIRDEIARFEAETGIPCAFEGCGTAVTEAPVVEAIARSAAEGLANVARHAQAGNASIVLSMDGGMLVTSIADDGTGFDPDGIPPGHYGLVGIQERVRALGGSLDVESSPGKGARLTLKLPLRPGTA